MKTVNEVRFGVHVRSSIWGRVVRFRCRLAVAGETRVQQLTKCSGGTARSVEWLKGATGHQHSKTELPWLRRGT